MSKKVHSAPIKTWSEWFERAARHYKDHRMKMSYYRDAQTGRPVPFTVMKRIYRDIWKKLKARKHHSLLEVGCGVGYFYRDYQKKVKRMTGTDISAKMVEDARRVNPRGKFFTCESHKLPFPGNSFDRLLCFSVFHYFSSLAYTRKVLNEFDRVTAPGAIILIGDLVLPGSDKKSATHNGAAKAWWPDFLSHRLKKLRFRPDFFKKYCRQKGFKCEILRQRIPGRFLPETRYDVRITKNK